MIGIFMRKLFGFLAIFIGCSIIIWILYNVFVERQETFKWSWWQGFGISIPMISVGIYWLKTRSSKDTNYHQWKEEDK